ncbi:LRR receptor-like serine/threonine-protein kinase [Benincasa hispida]|uniref:LRR receptor-like serine/threonine-protein kinase n=1 Tax=Benincasa hispida TaxID=102211 RepID=UPI00190271AC|nr:LRR receptor-like serine/threonine-protein kinase [Benincasa hispida]
MPAILKNPFLPLHFFTIALILCIKFLLFSSCYSIDEQGRALLEWKNNLTSPTDVLSSWNPEATTPCSWLGVVCNSNGEVEEIALRLLELQGTLPTNFQALKSLRILVISETNITGRIPTEFGDYNKLNVLDLSKNNLLGKIPEEICRLSELQDLFLNNNDFEGNIPLNIGNLSSLVNFQVNDNDIDGEIPKSIGMLKNLYLFKAGGNRLLEGLLPKEIGNCSSLTVLGLSDSGIYGPIPSSIGMLQRLQTLHIYKSQLFDALPEEITNCSELQTIRLYQNGISGPLPRRIGEMKKLKILLLWLNLMEGEIPEEIGNCNELVVFDLSENLLTGPIPKGFGRLPKLQDIQLSLNQLTGAIPPEIFNISTLLHLEIDNNKLSGEIPDNIGNMKNLRTLLVWGNNLTGTIPLTLADSPNLTLVDLSLNHLTGPIPAKIFAMKELTKLLLLSNNLSGIIPSEIGNCSTLSRLRLSMNKLGGTIPSKMGNLKNLELLDMGDNFFVGGFPSSFSKCDKLESLDLRSNRLTSLPNTLPKNLVYFNISNNRLKGQLNPDIGGLLELTKLDLKNNQLSGKIPAEIVSCEKIQYLDLSSNFFSGELPKQLGTFGSLEIALNLSHNQFSGQIPYEFSGLTKLSILDLSHNNFSGELSFLSELENLVILNISYNDFSGKLPDTPFFQKLPESAVIGNKNLLYGEDNPKDNGESSNISRQALHIAMPIFISICAVLLFLAFYMPIRTHMARFIIFTEGNKWEITLFQKLDFSIDHIIRNLTTSNVIGTGSAGAVYRIPTPNGETMAVKKMWSTDETSFNTEIEILGSIRHKNIIRLLGWGCNRNVKLLFYDYLPNGNLSSLIHGPEKGEAEWEVRYEVLLGVAHALAYLHHDCIPPILHGDVKTMNILLGHKFEPYLADFGIAKIMSTKSVNDGSQMSLSRSQLAGSFGYMAPEQGSMLRVTEKSDVYSFGVVIMEVLTGRHPLDPTLPGGANLVQWVQDHFATHQNTADIFDSKLRGRTDPTMHEMIQTLAVALICASVKADDRPSMKDVVGMLEEIRQVGLERAATDDTKSEIAVVVESPP